MRRALYPGSFDPITQGHVDIVNRALEIFDEVELGVAVNVNKRPTFGDDERIDMIKETFNDDPRVKVSSFTGLLVDYARDRGIRSVVRGLRAARIRVRVSDGQHESTPHGGC